MGILVSAALLALAALGTTPSGDSPAGSERRASGRAELPAAHPRGALASCNMRSEARFPGAYDDPENVVVGPLAMSGATYTSPETIEEFHGNKFPLMVAAGHTVTLQLPKVARRHTRLNWGRRRGAPKRLARSTVNFVACRPGQDSGSSADGREVTFWSGSVGTRQIQCLRLRVFIDDRPRPRRASLGLGQPCE